jgi:hypothetical protein
MLTAQDTNTVTLLTALAEYSKTLKDAKMTVVAPRTRRNS